MQAIPLHWVAIILPFVRFLSEIGAPVEKGFQQAGLPFEALNNLNNFVPSQRFWAFVGNMARSQGIEDLGFRVGQRYGANCADPQLSALLCQSPTLYDALITASKLVNKTISRSRIGLLHPQHSDHIHFFHRPSFDTHNPFIDQIDWFGLMALVGMVRLFAGPQWQPTQIALTNRHAPSHAIREQFPDTRIVTSEQYAYITLENTLLSLPPLIHNSAAPPSFRYEPVATDFAGSLKQALGPYVGKDNLTMAFAAALCNTSKRTLQRKLAATGNNYSELVDRVRFDVAKDMLQHPDTKVTDVALHLGYSDTAHFARAFRRISGMTPRVYRQAYSH